MSIKQLSQRQRRLGEQVKKALAELLQRGAVRSGALALTSITITEVQVSPDMRHANVYILPLGGENTEETLKALGKEAGYLHIQLRPYLASKYIPRLRFYPDTSFEQAARIEQLLSSLPPLE